eukprot:TRINITY_DN40730_c0_g1_i3.p1 TRINITY_DN40730_c0_g1~~TRINITY_DN40730_c0_g1_i3.p1  ORF type:complete len:128 (-),score=8.77 TRINITY_DN40730_c0_g1_i3:48-431(-)
MPPSQSQIYGNCCHDYWTLCYPNGRCQQRWERCGGHHGRCCRGVVCKKAQWGWVCVRSRQQPRSKELADNRTIAEPLDKDDVEANGGDYDEEDHDEHSEGFFDFPVETNTSKTTTSPPAAVTELVYP